jgi:hypothetical protein
MNTRRTSPTLLVSAAIAGCGGSPSTVSTTCGPGTALQDGVCVLADAGTADAESGGGNDSSAEMNDSTSSADSVTVAPDGNPPQDATTDVPTDSSLDAREPPSDPCPMPVSGYSYLWLDCDPQSQCDPNMASPLSQCSMIACGGGGTLDTAPGVPEGILRTPESPGVDPKCASECPAHPWAYGMSVTFSPPTPAPNGYVIASVSAPWFLVSGTNSPFCTNGTSPAPTNCLWFFANAETVIYVGTDDPNAPARNVLFKASSTPNACP